MQQQAHSSQQSETLTPRVLQADLNQKSSELNTTQDHYFKTKLPGAQNQITQEIVHEVAAQNVPQAPSSVSNIPTSVIQHAESQIVEKQQIQLQSAPHKLNNSFAMEVKGVKFPPATSAKTVTTPDSITSVFPNMSTLPCSISTVSSSFNHTTTTSELRQLRRPINRGKPRNIIVFLKKSWQMNSWYIMLCLCKYVNVFCVHWSQARCRLIVGCFWHVI